MVKKREAGIKEARKRPEGDTVTVTDIDKKCFWTKKQEPAMAGYRIK